MMRKGLFVTVEGGPGGGKTSLCDAIERRLGRAGVTKIVRISEPGGTAVGDSIRRLLLKYPGDSAEHSIDPNARYLLISAARAELVSAVIRPALVTGGVVLCDTFADTINADEATNRPAEINLRLSPQMVEGITERVIGDCVPDLSLLLDGDPETLLPRRRRKPGESDEAREEAVRLMLSKANRVRDYLRTTAQGRASFRIIDATASQEETAAAAWELVKAALRDRKVPFAEDPIEAKK